MSTVKSMREQIIREISGLVKERTGAFVSVINVTKNNGIILTGMCVIEADKNVAPTIYIDRCIEEVLTQNITVEDAVNEIVRIYEKHKDENPISKGFALNKDYILGKVEFKLVNKEMNKELLEEVPHREFLDLAVMYVVVVERDENGVASFLVRNEMLEAYGLTMEELEEAAVKNTYNAGFEKTSMTQIMAQMTGCDMGLSEEDNPMYIISNRARYNGANAMLFTQMFEDLAEKYESDLFILPSSIHEVLAIPVMAGMSENYLRGIVNEVNSTQVSMEERLSNSVYKFIRKEKKMGIA